MQSLPSSATDRQPANPEELIGFIARVVQEQHQRTGRGLDGSVLAHLIRREYPGLDYISLGMAKMGDAVRLAVSRNVIQQKKGVRHLEVTPIDTEPPAPARDLQFVRPDLWKAMVLSPHGSHYFFNQKSAELVQAGQSDVGRYRSDTNFVEVDPVTEGVQGQWLKDYLRSKGKVIDEDEETIRGLLRSGIRDFGSAIAQDWRTVRSRKAVDHVRQWASRHAIPDVAVLVPPNREPRKTRAPEQPAGEDRIRQAILASIGEMPLDELQGLAIPMRYILRHFSPKQP